ncbi:MAG: uracil-DNA glycosylase [Thermodesulfobacteriota bacterium]
MSSKNPNCFKCRNFYITHEPAHPYGCQAMGFKSRQAPSLVVLKNSGMPCHLFSPKE